MCAAALVGIAAVAPVAEGRQLSAARATFKVSLRGSYTATATAPYDSCSRWEPRADQPGEYDLKFFTMTAKATETAKLHTSKPATLKLAGPYGSIPLSAEGQRAGREAVAIQRSSNVHSPDGAPDGCQAGNSPGSPPQTFPGDCGSKSRKVGYTASATGGRSNHTKTSIVAGYSFDPFHACEVPGGVFFDSLQGKAERAAIRKARPRVSRLFSGSSRITERGSATARGVGSDKGSKATYTMHVKVTLRRSKLERARTG